LNFHVFFKEKILALCKEKNITVNKLSNLSGITQSTVDSILKGKSKAPRIDTLRKLAYGFNIDWIEFIRYIYPPDAEFDDID
jgi:transcriptional regulator with XRE-family HTH domain